MTTRGTKIAAAITTGLFAAMLGFSGLLYLAGAKMAVQAIHSLGYPDYFRPLLGLAKVAGVLALVIPGLRTLREWAYAGFTFNLIAAVASHLLSGDQPAHAMPALFALGLLITSYLLRRRIAAAEHSKGEREWKRSGVSLPGSAA